MKGLGEPWWLLAVYAAIAATATASIAVMFSQQGLRTRPLHVPLWVGLAVLLFAAIVALY